MKVVLDTNIWISGLLIPKSRAGRLIELWKSRELELITSDFIIHEIQKVLSYPKIQKHLKWSTQKIEQFAILIKFFSEQIILPDHLETPNVPKDLNDNAILATLLLSEAEMLITGDDDLLSLKKHYPIITLNDFFERFI